jgi:Tfp pilus assembly protein PilF
MTLRALPVLLLLTACSTQPWQDLMEPSVGASALKAGVRKYDEGSYADAARYLQGAIDLGLNDSEAVRAHKYLAFIHCASRRERACRDEFRRVLAINPAFQLSPAEAGHPAWGPVFAAVKAASPATPFKLALQQYEAGEYDESAKNFEGALREGLGDKERASAHKHLAFIHCASQRERQCREEFRKALEVDPALELDAAEAGHPAWGPVFRSVKAGH